MKNYMIAPFNENTAVKANTALFKMTETTALLKDNNVQVKAVVGGAAFRVKM